MALNVAIKYPELIDGVGSFAGLPYKVATMPWIGYALMINGTTLSNERLAELITTDMGDLVKTMPTIVIHGTDDTVVNPINSVSIRESFALVNNSDLIDEYDYMTKIGTPITYYNYENDDRKSTVRQYLVHNAGHSWIAGDYNDDIFDSAYVSYNFWIDYYEE